MKQKSSKKNNNSSEDDEEVPKKKKTNYKSLTPLVSFFEHWLTKHIHIFVFIMFLTTNMFIKHSSDGTVDN